jgi:hypothetical protein
MRQTGKFTMLSGRKRRNNRDGPVFSRIDRDELQHGRQRFNMMITITIIIMIIIERFILAKSKNLTLVHTLKTVFISLDGATTRSSILFYLIAWLMVCAF